MLFGQAALRSPLGSSLTTSSRGWAARRRRGPAWARGVRRRRRSLRRASREPCTCRRAVYGVRVYQEGLEEITANESPLAELLDRPQVVCEFEFVGLEVAGVDLPPAIRLTFDTVLSFRDGRRDMFPSEREQQAGTPLVRETGATTVGCRRRRPAPRPMETVLRPAAPGARGSSGAGSRTRSAGRAGMPAAPPPALTRLVSGRRGAQL